MLSTKITEVRTMKLQLIMLIQVAFAYLLMGAVLTSVFPPETGHVKIATFIAINVFIKIIPHPTSNNPFAFAADLRDWVYRSYGRDDLIINGDKNDEENDRTN